jgi:hypothetical protein
VNQPLWTFLRILGLVVSGVLALHLGTGANAREFHKVGIRLGVAATVGPKLL